MKKILFLIRTLNMGGAEHVLVNIANRMAEDGFSVTVQTLLDEGLYRAKLNSNVRYCGGFPVKTYFGKAAVMWLYRKLPARWWSKLLIENSYTYLVAFTEGLPTKFISSCHQKSVKKIAWIHTDLYTNYQLGAFFSSVDACRKCYDRFDQLICVSQDTKNGYIKRFGNHRSLEVQYNPIEKQEVLNQAQSVPAYKCPENKSFRLFALGRLVHVKGYDLLIEAMVKVKNMVNRPVELYLIGSGNEEATLRKIVSEYQLMDTVFFCGQQENPYSIIRQCHLQVISSRAEGYSLALCEGLLLGLPALSTRCSGPTEIISSSQAGILVEVSAKGLADGIVKMVNDSKLYAQCRLNAQHWAESYDVDQVYSQIMSIFR